MTIDRIAKALNAGGGVHQDLVTLINAIPIYIVIKDGEGRWIAANQLALEMHGLINVSYVGKQVSELGDPTSPFSDCARHFETDDAVWDSGKPKHTESVCTMADGRFKAYDVLKVPVFHPNGDRNCLVVLCRDITDRKKEEHSLRESEAKYKLATENMSDLISLVDTQGLINYASPSFLRVVGFSPQATHFFDHIHPEDKAAAQLFFYDLIRTKTPQSFEFRYKHTKGHWIYLEAKGSPLAGTNCETESVVMVSRDITERKQAEKLIHHMAYYDELTGLGNRKLLLDKLEHSITRAKRSDQAIAVMSLNLDRFKHVNDTFGHASGDYILQNVADQLIKVIGEEGFVARLGNDEFAVYFPFSKKIEVSEKANKLIRAFSLPMKLQDMELLLTMSIGISCYPINGHDAEELLRNAYSAMCLAKDNRSGFEFFADQINEIFSRRYILEKSLYSALELKQFFLNYQPQIEVRTGRIIGVEALIRWEHPELGIVSPDEFIPMAEETGLIIPIGEYVLRTACEQHNKWLVAGLPPIRVAVNLSALQFRQPDLVQMVAEVLANTKMSPEFLEIEITESVAMTQVEEVIEKLNSLENLGVETSIDDFGTGYSSLACLQKFPIKALKIERSLIQQITKDSGSKSIVRAMINLAHNLDMKVTAEGIETLEHFRFLKRHKCDRVQGFFFSKPLSADRIEKIYESLQENILAVV
ncbi:EAL domain-containing protein [Paenibacillus aestuarii]|uniref:EAL domain-containing protein n=1 Tax=Paenibacillus aestuarii TaxID=516965 RepID=A0ABW0K732_9BACL